MPIKMFSQERIRNNYTFYFLSQKTGIDSRTLNKYEMDSFQSSKLIHVVKLVHILGGELTEYFDMDQIHDEVLAFQQQVSMKKKYNETLDKLYFSHYNKVFVWNKRSKITEEENCAILHQLDEVKSKYMHLKDENGMLSKDDTDEFEIDCNSILINYTPLLTKLSDGPGKTLRKNRLVKGLEIEELASLCGLSVITMKYYENGKRSLLSMDTMAALKLCCLFDITIEDLIGNNIK